MPLQSNLTILLPCKDEAATLPHLLEHIQQSVPEARIIVIDDGSKDNTPDIVKRFNADLITHHYSLGNGAAIKSGLRSAATDYVVCMDADGQHRPEDIPNLLEFLAAGYDMVVGARRSSGQANKGRSLANRFYNYFAGIMVGHNIPDLTSGYRAFRRDKAMEFLHLLPNGFSYPTTLTMAFFRAGYLVKYVSIDVRPRSGKSHISIIRDGIRFLLIIFKVGTLYSPLKIFFPASFILFSSGVVYYIFTYITAGRFTNMGTLLFLSSITIFLIGLVSEQITTLMYNKKV